MRRRRKDAYAPKSVVYAVWKTNESRMNGGLWERKAITLTRRGRSALESITGAPVAVVGVPRGVNMSWKGMRLAQMINKETCRDLDAPRPNTKGANAIIFHRVAPPIVYTARTQARNTISSVNGPWMT